MRFDLTTIFVANLLCWVLLGVLLVGNVRRFSSPTREEGYLRAFGAITLTGSIIDTVNYWFAGTPGQGVHALLWFCNTYTYTAYLMISYMWIMFLGLHVRSSVSSRWRAMVSLPLLIEAFMLWVGNVHTHFAFSLDDQNIFHRGPFFFIFFATLLGYCILGLAIHLVHGRKRRTLRFFPVWAFIMPVIIGCAVQIRFYGVPLVWASLAIALAGILSSRQNEHIYRDNLTGLLNRSYLQYLLGGGRNRLHYDPLGIMIDVNGFKNINDTYGHLAGDRALTQVADVLRTVVDNHDAIIRYAGDEFVVLVNPSHVGLAGDYMRQIAQEFERFNASGAEPWDLTVSMGCAVYNGQTMSLDEFLRAIDDEMYEDKRSFYEQASNDRRRAQ